MSAVQYVPSLIQTVSFVAKIHCKSGAGGGWFDFD